MPAHVVVFQVRQAGLQMPLGRFLGKRPAGARRERAGKAAPALCAAQIEPVEMCDLSVRPVGDAGWLEQVFRLA